jgi:hypothetical protein
MRTVLELIAICSIIPAGTLIAIIVDGYIRERKQ